MQVAGNFSKPVTGVTVNGVPAVIQPGKTFQANIPVTAGNNTITVKRQSG